ncbi:hypothetical protein TNCV_642541 [Trichonephila clavipes]|nr:hypothetical protein TNCV_642541 [Trichonephila clavipes]
MPISKANRRRVVLGAFRHIHGHQNTARRNGTRLKRRHWAAPTPNFVVLRTRIAISLYAALSMQAEVMVTTLLQMSCRANGYRACFKHAPFLTNGPWCVSTV